MAILDKENRPRGLRIPSAISSKLHKKSPEPAPQPQPQSQQELMSLLYPQYPARTDSVPVRPPRPHDEKDLPPQPIPSRRPVRAPVPTEPVNPAPAPAPTPAPTYTRNDIPASQPYRAYNASHSTTTFTVQPPTLTLTREAPTQPPSEEEDPLEDFIPEPEPELDDAAHHPDSVSSDENNGPWTPPEIEPVVVPLNKLHFACYQEHQSMMPANNVWYSLPCMTCQKFDREVRYRCVFCCLRICADCNQSLQKVPSRSLAQFLETIPSKAGEE